MTIREMEVLKQKMSTIMLKDVNLTILKETCCLKLLRVNNLHPELNGLLKVR